MIIHLRHDGSFSSYCGREGGKTSPYYVHTNCEICMEEYNKELNGPARNTRTDGAGVTPSAQGSGTAPEAKDSVNRPSHYTSGSVECIDAIDSAVAHLMGREAFYTAQVIKYVWRWKLKNGVEDLKKAKWYLERLIGVLS